MAAKQSIVALAPLPATSGAWSAPPTSRQDGAAISLGDAFVERVDGQFFIDTLVDEVVESACDDHLQRVYQGIAIDYTACAMWAEMVALVTCSVVPYDEGYRSTAEMAVAEGSRSLAEHHHDPWKPDVPPQRVVTEEHARGVVDVRSCMPKVEVSVGGGGRKKRGDGPRPSSSQTSNIDDAAARTLLGARYSLKPRSTGSVDLSATQTMRPSGNPASPLRSALNTRLVARTLAGKTSPVRNELDVSQTRQAEETLSQPDYVTDETEVKLHRDNLARLASEREESVKKAQRIGRVLSDPKSAPKAFTIDTAGAVISVGQVDDARVQAQAESLSPRFLVPQQPAPPPPPEVPATGHKGRSRVGGAGGKAEGQEKKPRAVRDAKRDEAFMSTDARDVPMQIRVAPAGGVCVKDAGGPPRVADLKTPSTKMSKSDFLRLRGVIGTNDNVNSTSLQGRTADERHDEARDDREGHDSPRVDGEHPMDAPQPSNLPANKRGNQGTAPPALPVKKTMDQKNDTARKPPQQSPNNPAAAQTARTAVAQAPAPPPNRAVLPNRAVNTRKMQVEKYVPTKVNDKQFATLAETWQGQRVANEAREPTRVIRGAQQEGLVGDNMFGGLMDTI